MQPKDYQTEILGAEQQRKTSQAMREQAMQAPQGRMIGGWYVAPHPLQYLSQLLQQYTAKEDEKKAQKAIEEAGVAKQKELADLLRNYGKTTEVTPTQNLMNTFAQNQPQGTMTDAAIQGYMPGQQPMTQTNVRPATPNEQFQQEARIAQLDPFAAKALEARQAREENQANRLEQIRLQRELAAQQAGQGGNAYYQPLQTANGVFAFNARTGKVEQVQGPGGQPVVGAQFNPELQQQLAASKGMGQEQAKLGGQKLEHVRDATESNTLLDQVEQIGPVATGSALGRMRDVAGNVVGMTTEGANAAAQMNVLGASLVSKVPKMSGPQSDKDAAMYKAAAGNIADPNIPWEQKQAAIRTIRQINNRQIQYGNPAFSGQTPNQPKVIRFDAQGNMVR